jgi:hypothetical protein
MIEPTALSKTEFIARVTDRARRYGVNFGRGRLDEWIKQALAFAGDPPKRTYGYRHYRRVLQLIRFHAHGVKDRDELLVQLFICGYGARAHEVREALLKEFRKARAKLNSPIRSIYADREGAIPAGRAKQFRREMGEADGRLQRAGFVPTDEFLIAAVRDARNPDYRNNSNEQAPAPSQLAPHAWVDIFGGMLADGNEFATEFEHLIQRSGPEEYAQARNYFLKMRMALQIFTSSENRETEEAFAAAQRSMLQREMAAFFLVIALKNVAS